METENKREVFMMGIFLNPDNTNFQKALNSKIYVDKTEMIRLTNEIINTEQQYVCISRPRRFGKSMAANMLVAYYSRGCDSRELFKNYKIANDASFEQHLNQYNVIHINMTRFINNKNSMDESLQYIEEDIIDEIREEMPDLVMPRRITLVNVLDKAYAKYKVPFIFIIDEWDCVFREHKDNETAQRDYLIFLRDLLKNQSYVALTYMTGILPIKKYGDHSALNMFTEICMTYAEPFSEYTGFTESEVTELCNLYGKSYDEMKRWYDGYDVDGIAIYNPKSVVESLTRGKFQNFWTLTETYKALQEYIVMNFDGLQDTIIKLLAGERHKVDISNFANDMVTFQSADDVLTLLIHLGYLTYDAETEEVFIPNYEINEQFASTIRNMDWSEVTQLLKRSEDLLKATLNCDAKTVAELIEQCHQDNTSILSYNDENSLSCVISLAYYAARKDYFMIRELPTGKGYADIVFLPRKNRNVPALVIELKWNQDADTAIQQIKQKQYTDSLSEYSGNILLVGINYDKKEKQHTCLIEEVQK